jgi:hypothetical protein
MNFTALEASAAAFIPNDQWSTPTKTPEFRMEKNGVNCMIEVAPVEIVVPVIHPAKMLNVCFSHVHAMGDGADIEIVASTGSESTTLLSSRVPALINDDFPVWREYAFALPPETQKIHLRVLDKSDSTADWVAIRDFSFD